uniref:Uncharacterized protein n=1 Tax=Corethron hystrix TaxID=216773 RepID=A0A7S1FY36_9STRA|mmetsp:Transcript_37420/g.87264  ORF Transcript_37420/g.87264 Transcript_37420/m.87264 type:complete len:221 (+) Transcript_37420:87-749(+)
MMKQNGLLRLNDRSDDASIKKQMSPTACKSIQCHWDVNDPIVLGGDSTNGETTAQHDIRSESLEKHPPRTLATAHGRRYPVLNSETSKFERRAFISKTSAHTTLIATHLREINIDGFVGSLRFVAAEIVFQILHIVLRLRSFCSFFDGMWKFFHELRKESCELSGRVYLPHQTRHLSHAAVRTVFFIKFSHESLSVLGSFFFRYARAGRVLGVLETKAPP